ncbi:XRE family transcriptional regulator [Enterorhabdus caecimuris]|nr:XRE family transcriptional regulator [Adlercreutzia caecimuris]
MVERTHVDQAVVSRVERGRGNVTANLVADLAEALGKQVCVTLE